MQCPNCYNVVNYRDQHKIQFHPVGFTAWTCSKPVKRKLYMGNWEEFTPKKKHKLLEWVNK